MFTLIGLGVGVAYLNSLVAVFFPQIFPASFEDSMTGKAGLYFEAAAVIVTLVITPAARNSYTIKRRSDWIFRRLIFYSLSWLFVLKWLVRLADLALLFSSFQ